MQNIEAILTKFTATPGMCNLSELRKLRSFLSGFQKNVIKFSKNTGTEPTVATIAQIIDDATLCYEMHENYKAEYND